MDGVCRHSCIWPMRQQCAQCACTRIVASHRYQLQYNLKYTNRRSYLELDVYIYLNACSIRTFCAPFLDRESSFIVLGEVAPTYIHMARDIL